MPRRAEARTAGRLRHPSRLGRRGPYAARGAVECPHGKHEQRVPCFSPRCNPANQGETMLGALSRRAPALRSVGSTGARLLPRQQVRSMGAGGPRGYGSGEYRGLKVPKPERWQTNVATFYGTMMWLCIFHRARHDGKAMLVRQAARTRSGRVRLLPGFCAQNAMLAELTCAVPLCAGSRASLGRASLTCRHPPVHCAQPPRLFAASAMEVLSTAPCVPGVYGKPGYCGPRGPPVVY